MGKFKDFWNKKGVRIGRRSVAAALLVGAITFGAYNAAQNFDGNGDVNQGKIDNTHQVDTLPAIDPTKPEQIGGNPQNPVNGFDTENFTPSVTPETVDISSYINKNIAFNYTLINKAGNKEILMERKDIYTLNLDGTYDIITHTTINGVPTEQRYSGNYSVDEQNNTILFTKPYHENGENNNTACLYMTYCLDENGNQLKDENGNNIYIIGNTVIDNQITKNNVLNGVYYVEVSDLENIAGPETPESDSEANTEADTTEEFETIL